MTNYYNIYRIYDWYDKLELLTFISLLTGIALNINPISSLVATLVFTVTSLAYGFILNSYADRKEDIAVGKDRYFGQKEVTIKVYTILSLIASTLLLFYFLTVLRNYGAFLVGFSSLVFLTLYSYEPFRFKTHAFLAYTVQFSLRVFPYVIFLKLANIVLLSPITIYFILYLMLTGLKTLIRHQTHDYENDLKTQTVTFVTKIGLPTSKTLLQLITTVLFIATISMFLFVDLHLAIILLISMSFFKFRSGPYK